MPALNAAIDSLKALNKNDIVEIKSFAKPPPLVQMTLEAVCILKQEKPDWDTVRKPGSSKRATDKWCTAPTVAAMTHMMRTVVAALCVCHGTPWCSLIPPLCASQDHSGAP
jgi:hypothetical protein